MVVVVSYQHTCLTHQPVRLRSNVIMRAHYSTRDSMRKNIVASNGRRSNKLVGVVKD